MSRHGIAVTILCIVRVSSQAKVFNLHNGIPKDITNTMDVTKCLATCFNFNCASWVAGGCHCSKQCSMNSFASSQNPFRADELLVLPLNKRTKVKAFGKFGSASNCTLVGRARFEVNYVTLANESYVRVDLPSKFYEESVITDGLIVSIHVKLKSGDRTRPLLEFTNGINYGTFVWFYPSYRTVWYRSGKSHFCILGRYYECRHHTH